MKIKNFAYALAFVLIVPPGLVNYGVKNWPLSSVGDEGDWIGFWSSYLGTIVSVIIAVVVFKKQIETEDKRRAVDFEIKLIEHDKSRSAEFVSLSKTIRNSLKIKNAQGSLNDAMHFSNQLTKISSSTKMKDISNTLFSDIYKIYRKYEELPSDTALEMIDYNDLQFKIRNFEDGIENLSLLNGINTPIYHK